MEGKRQYLLDGLRGLTLISMILYHGMFDLLEIYGVHVSWFGDYRELYGSRVSAGALLSCRGSVGI